MTEHEQQETSEFEVKNIATGANRFSQKLNELREFSKKLPAQSELPSVPQSGGLFGWFDYDVKGSDLNKLTQSIQDKMIAQNQVLVRTIQEFHKVYETFTLLDKEYIYGILNSIEAAEEANRKALKGLDGVEKHQVDIQNLINQQQVVIQVLKKHKEKLEKLKHLESIDKIYSDLSEIKIHFQEFITKQDNQNNEIVNLNESIYSLKSIQSTQQDSLIRIKEKLEHEIEQLSRQFLTQTKILTTLKSSNIEHYASIEKLQLDYEFLQKQVQKMQEEIRMSFDSINLKLSDSFQMLKKNIAENKTLIDEMVDAQIQNLALNVEKEKKSVTSYVNSELLNHQQVIQNQNIIIEKLTKEMKSSKILSYISIMISFVLVILIISGVL